MRRRLIIGAVVLFFVAIFYWVEVIHKSNSGPSQPKPQALKVGLHSALFNTSIDSMMNAYFNMKNDFVNDDSVKAKEDCTQMIAISGRLKMDELKKDTSGVFDAATMQVNDVQANAQSLIQEKDITDMRKDFQMVSESIYPLLKTIHYEGKILYWQNCPMAFGEGKDASWISNIQEIENPYLGNKDKSMEHCGEIKDSIVSK